MATFVYLAFPEKEAVRAPFLKSIGLGLLEVDENNAVKESIEFPYEGIGLQSIMELHPTDYKREMRLAEQIKEMKKNAVGSCKVIHKKESISYVRKRIYRRAS